MIRVVHPGPDSDFLPQPGSRGQKGTGSRIRNTGFKKIFSLKQPKQFSPVFSLLQPKNRAKKSYGSFSTKFPQKYQHTESQNSKGNGNIKKTKVKNTNFSQLYPCILEKVWEFSILAKKHRKDVRVKPTAAYVLA